MTPNKATSESSAQPLFTGMASLKVVGINPTQEQTKALGYRAEKAPVYKDEKNGQRIAFMLESVGSPVTIRTNVAFFLKDKKREDIFINTKGKFGKDRTTLGENVRNPFEGEIELLNFVKNWLDIKKDEELYLKTIETIVKTGDLVELLSYHRAVPDNLLRGMLYVREGKYQAVWSKEFLKIYAKDSSYMHKKLVDNEAHLKGDFGPVDFKLYNEAQFALRPYTQTAAVASAAPVHSNGSAAPTPPAVDADGEIAPF